MYEVEAKELIDKVKIKTTKNRFILYLNIYLLFLKKEV